MIDPTFETINRLFVLSFKNGDNVPTRNSPGIDSWVQSWVSWDEPGLSRKPSS